MRKLMSASHDECGNAGITGTRAVFVLPRA